MKRIGAILLVAVIALGRSGEGGEDNLLRFGRLLR
jgi:hypothetical protein